MSALAELVAERFPNVADVEAEALRPVPPIPFRRGAEGMARLQILMLAVRSGRRP